MTTEPNPIIPTISTIATVGAFTIIFIDLVRAYIHERAQIARKQAAGSPRPWSTDPILHTFRFCQLEREADYTTREIRKLWREPHADDRELWFAIVIARVVNLPASLRE